MSGILILTLTKMHSSNEYRPILETCLQEYQHLSKLIENLLFLARSEHGQITLSKENIDAKETILKIIDG